MKITCFSKTDVGLKRTVNQDSIFCDYGSKTGIFIVADGMGGYSKGEIASGTVINSIKNWWTGLDRDTEKSSITDIASEFKNLIINVSDSIYRCFSREGLTGGTTVAALIIWDNSVGILNVGDSRVYGVTNNIEQLSYDDIWDNLQTTQDNLDAEEILRHPNHGKLMSAVGVGEEPKINYQIKRITGKESFLLCSDGIYKYCDFNILNKSMLMLNRVANLGKISNKIIESVISNGAKDNYSLILVRCRKRLISFNKGV